MDFDKSLAHRLRIAAGRLNKLAAKIEAGKDHSPVFRRAFRLTLDYVRKFEGDFNRYAQHEKTQS